MKNLIHIHNHRHHRHKLRKHRQLYLPTSGTLSSEKLRDFAIVTPLVLKRNFKDLTLGLQGWEVLDIDVAHGAHHVSPISLPLHSLFANTPNDRLLKC